MASAEIKSKQHVRPLSPHLQIYKLTWTMVMSIMHRITGVGLYIGTLLLAWWLLAIAGGPDTYYTAQYFFGSIIGRFLLFCYTWALLHHMLGGVRHFIWDFGYGFKERERFLLARMTLFGGLAATVILWIIVYAVG